MLQFDLFFCFTGTARACIQEHDKQTDIMLVNFAVDCIGTKISCDKVSSDGYEPDNLLCHGRGWHRSQGFLAERFIKPPITVTLTFPCPVNLSHLVIDPQVGSQRSSTIEIYTAVRSRLQKRAAATESQTGASAATTDRSGGSRDATENTNGTLTDLEPIFKRVGSVRCLEPGQVCFDNPRFVHTLSSTDGNFAGSYQYHLELRHHQWMMLSAVEFLAVRILYTVNGSIAAIGRLEVWGQPARSCPPQLREVVLQKYAAAVGLPLHHSSDVSDQKTGVKGGKKGDTDSPCNSQNGNIKTHSIMQDSVHVFNKENNTLPSHSQLPPSCTEQAPETGGVDIPEEFLDELTFDIMSTPMLLPSGHSIDVFTLERFSDAEATYGRQPSDPFTGLVFTSTRQPVLNETLKMRIDRFLSEHADEPSLRHVPRALGRAVQSPRKALNSNSDKTGKDHARSVDRRTRSSVQNLKQEMENRLQHKESNPCVKDAQHNFPPSVASTVSDVTPPNKKAKTEQETIPPVKASSSRTLTGCSGPVATTTNSESHEERLRSSLTSSLSSVLRGLPSFTTPAVEHPSPGTVPSGPDQCSSCRTKLGQVDAGARTAEHSVTYMLPCEHLMCRVCLVATGSVNSVMCTMCHRQFARADVVRTHIWCLEHSRALMSDHPERPPLFLDHFF